MVCLSEPVFPAFADGAGQLNFTVVPEYEKGLEDPDPIREWDFVSFQCPEGYLFDQANESTAYAVCHNWRWLYSYQPDDDVCIRE